MTNIALSFLIDHIEGALILMYVYRYQSPYTRHLRFSFRYYQRGCVTPGSGIVNVSLTRSISGYWFKPASLSTAVITVERGSPNSPSTTFLCNLPCNPWLHQHSHATASSWRIGRLHTNERGRECVCSLVLEPPRPRLENGRFSDGKDESQTTRITIRVVNDRR